MKKIKIVAGTYGYHKDKASPVELIGNAFGCATDVCTVADEEAERLIKLEVAVEVCDTVEETKELEEYTIAELKDLAGRLGLEFKSRATKDELIKLISATDVHAPAADDVSDEEGAADDVPGAEDDEEADNEKPPVLSAADPE